MNPGIGGRKDLRGARVRALDILGREFIGTVITHVRDNRWCVDFNGERVTLPRRQFTLESKQESRKR